MAPIFLAIHVHWEGDPTFSGRHQKGSSQHEWPPAPARIFSALVAGAAASASSSLCFQALDVLEQLPSPFIIGGDAFEACDPLHYTPKVSKYPQQDWYFSEKGKPKDATKDVLEGCLRVSDWHGLKAIHETVSYGKRINGARSLSSPDLTYFVPLDELPIEKQLRLAEHLEEAAVGVPYFGCSSDVATVTVSLYEGELPLWGNRNQRVWIPTTASSNLSLRSWSAGYLQGLKKRHIERTTVGLIDSGFPDSLLPDIHYITMHTHDEFPYFILAVEPSVKPQKMAQFLARLPELPGCTLTPLLFSNKTHGDGRLMGLLVRAQTFAEAVVGAQKLVTNEWIVEVSSYKQSLDPKHFLKKSCGWRSVTPVRSYSTFEHAYFHVLLNLCKQTDLMPEEILDLELTPAPSINEKGRAQKVGPAELLTPGFVNWHMSVRFQHPVTGPLSIGIDTRYGSGQLTQIDFGESANV